MLTNIVNVFLQFKWFMLLNVGITILAGAFLWLCTEKFSFRKKNRYVFAFFIGMTARDILWVTVSFTWLVFVVSMAVLGGDVNMVQLFFLLLLVLMRLMLKKDIRSLPSDAVNAVLLYLALLIGTIMREYLQTIRFDWMILLVYIFLILSVIHYVLYNFLKDMLFITAERSRKHVGKDKE